MTKERKLTLKGADTAVVARVTPVDAEHMRAAAAGLSLPLGAWARMRLIEAAREEVPDFTPAGWQEFGGRQ